MKSWNIVFIFTCFFTSAFSAYSPEIRLTSAIASSVASSTCAEDTFAITSPYGIIGQEMNCSMNHPINLLFDGDENTWWQSVTEDENVTISFQFDDPFLLSGAQLAFRSPLPQLLLVQARFNSTLVATLAYADDCQVYSGTCYPLESIVDYEVMNCSEISLCPRLVNLRHSLLNTTADNITYMFININTELLNTPESQYYAVAEVTIYGYLPANYYFSSLHSIVVEAESGVITGNNDPLPLLTAIPQFSGIGYTTNDRILPFSWFIEIPRPSYYRMILRYGNSNNFIEAPLVTVTSVVMSMARNGSEYAYRFFIDGCDMAWCYSQAVGTADTTTVVSYQLAAGLWEISALMNLQNILLDAFIAIPEEFYNPVSLGLAGAERFNDECGLSTNTLGRGTASEYFCFQSTFILSYNFNPMLYECACDAIGSVEQLCDPIGGQCPCIQPINGSTHPYGLNCDVCPSLSYGPTNTGCEECNCSNNLQQCDKRNGQCPCPSLVVGRQCSACELNTFGDPAVGCTPCLCDEPGTTACNATSGECICEPYYAGVTCGQCMIDAFNDTVAGCQPCQCNLTGSINQSCSAIGQCNCKPLVIGPKCSSCEAGAFHFTDNGCIECWCNGLTEIECDAFTGSYQTVTVRFNTSNDIEGWSLAVLNGDEFFVTTTGIYLEEFGDTEETVLSANVSNINSSMPIYWNVSSTYVNMNWLLTYGADLVVETIPGNGIINVGSANGVESRTGSLYSLYGVYLMDDSTVLVHSIDPTMDINVISIALVEDSWLDASTGRPVTRPAFMSVLARLSTILLPAVPADSSITITRLTSFQYGNASTIGNNKIPIESCSCPEGHSGSSCQECTDGYFMSSSGVCILCQCNGHSTDCDPVTGQCQDCQNNTIGFNCEECLPCYISITSGSSFMCEACNCSSTGCRNCSINIFGEEQCACLTGYRGEQCSLCDDGYFQSPLSGECILSCGECVDKLVMMHNESMLDVTTLQNRFRTLNDDLNSIYQQLRNITSQAISVMDRINVSLDVHQQLEDDLKLVDDCGMDVNNITLQVNALWQQAMQLHIRINSIPNLTNNTDEAVLLYRTTSTFNMTVFVVLSQLESLSMQANTILMSLTDAVAANMYSYVNEINESLQVLQNASKTQASAANVERVVSAHQGKLINVTDQLEALSMNVSSLNAQVEQLNMGVADFQTLTFEIQELRLITMSLFSNVSNNYNGAINVLQSAIPQFTTAIYLEQNITAQLQTVSERLVDLDGGSGSGNQGGEVFQELSSLEGAIENSFAFLSAINNSQAVADSSTHTNQLDINATIISRILVPALSMQPAEIVRNFSGLLASIEVAANKSMQANTTIIEIRQEVMRLMSEGLTDRAIQLYNLAQNLTSILNITYYGMGEIQAIVNQVNKEADISRNEIEDLVELTLNQVSVLQTASNAVQNQVDTALDSANLNLQCVSEGLYQQQCEVDEELYDRLNAADNSMRNSAGLLNAANVSLTNTLAIIDNQTKIIPDIQNQSIANSKQIEQLNISVQTLRDRMATARMALSSIAVALRLSGNQTYSYSLPTAADEGSAEHTQLSVIFRTIGPDGTLLYTSNSMDQCVSLGLVNRQVVFSFVLDTMSIIVNNPLSVQDDIWYQVFATRDEDVGRLSVTELQGATVTIATGIGPANASEIPLMDEIYIGGTSSMTTGNCVSSEQFMGCVDTVIVNSQTLPLLLPNEGFESVTPCGPRPPVEPTRLFDSSAWLLGAGSYVILRGEQQSTDVFRVMMGFRTFNPHGIFYISGTLRIHLMDGQVWFRISGIFSECEVNTVQRYDNNIWHYVTALYSGGECSVTVDDEMVIQSTELTFSTDISDVYIGGVPMVPERVPFVSFAGCIRDVIIGTVARNLSDNMGSERVNFNGCPVNVTSGVRFNGEGYALLEIATELINVNLTNIMFSFKTTQVTGLLLQLGSENKLILTLYHSHVRLEYYYNTGSAAIESPSPGYNDNFWHTVSVTLANNMITLMVDSVIATSQVLPTITLSDQLITIGGAYPNNFLSNVAINFRGCFRDLVINNQSHDFYNPISLVGVSLFGCYSPADLPFVPTSTVVTMATASTIPSVSMQTPALSPLSTTANVITTPQMIFPTATFSPQTLDIPATLDLSSMTMTSTVVLATPTTIISSSPIIIAENSTSIVSETLTFVVSTSVVSETSTFVISETLTSILSGSPTSVIAETPTSVISEISTSMVLVAPTSAISETQTSVVLETLTSVVSTSVVSEIIPSVTSETPTSSVVSETPTSIVLETLTSVFSTSVVSETLPSVISETPTASVVSETSTSSVVSEIPTSIVLETLTSVVSTSVVSETLPSVTSETPTASVVSETPTSSVVSETPTSIVLETLTSVFSTSVVSETLTSVISETLTSVVSETPTSIVLETLTSVVSTSVVSETLPSVTSETPTASVVSETPTSSVVSETPTSIVLETLTSVFSTSVVSETLISVISETLTSVVSETPTSIVLETLTSVVSTSIVSETLPSVISETPTASVVSETPTSSVVSETPTSIVLETLTSVFSTSVVSETLPSVISETPTASVVSETSTSSVVSETPTSIVLETLTSVFSTSVVSETLPSVISETPTASVVSETSTSSVVSETPTSIVLETLTSVVSTSVVSETLPSVISETPTASVVSETPTSSVVSETPTSIVLETSTSAVLTSLVSGTSTPVILDTPTSVFSETPTSVISVTSTFIGSETSTSLVSGISTPVILDTPTSVFSETPTSVISVTSTLIGSETSISLVSGTSTPVISETPTSIVLETLTSVVSTSMILETPTSIVLETLASVVSTSVVSETQTSVISGTLISVVSETPVSTSAVLGTLSPVISETSTSVVSETPTSVFSDTLTAVVSISVVSETLTSVISETPTSVVSETPTFVVSETPTSVISVASTFIVSETSTSVVLETQASIISETSTSPVSTSLVSGTSTPIISTSVILETPTFIISETPTFIVSETSASVVSETQASIVSETPTLTFVITETSTSSTSLTLGTSAPVISETSTSVISETPTSMISVTSTFIGLKTSTSVVSTSLVSGTSTLVISDTPTSVVSETPTSMILESPTSIRSETSTSAISESSTSIILETSRSMVSGTPTFIVSETSASIFSETQASIISETPMLTFVISTSSTSLALGTSTSEISETSASIISETSTLMISATPTSTISTSVVSETPTSMISVASTFIASETAVSTSLVSGTSTPVISETPTSVFSETPTSVILETPTSIISETPTSIISETPTSIISETSTSVVSGTPIFIVSETSASVVSETQAPIISETPTLTSVISETSTSAVSTSLVLGTSTPVISETPTSVISVTSTFIASETPTSVILETSTTSIISETSTSVISETSTITDTLISTPSSGIMTPLVTATETSLTAVLDSTITMTATLSSVIPLSSQSTEIPITPTSTVTSLISTSPTTAFISTSVVSTITTTTATIVISETTIPVERSVSTEPSISTTTDITPASSLPPVSSVTATDLTSVMPLSIESSATSTTVSSVASSTVVVNITTSSSEVSTLAATLSSETPIITTTDASTSVITTSSSLVTISDTSTSTVTSLLSLTTSQTPTISTTTTEISPSTSVLTTSTTILPTSTPLPQLLGLNGLSSFISLAPRSDLLFSYNIQLVFQTRSNDGILLYTGNVENGDYFALYLRNGLVTYSFDLGGGTVTVASNRQYSDGLLHNVTINRNGHVSLMTIDDGAEVIRAVGSTSFTLLNLGMDNFYVGGVTSPVVPINIFGQGEQSFPSVEACIKSLHINNEQVDLNVNTNNSGIVECSDVLLDDVATFTGNNSYAKLVESFSPITDFQLTMSFRNSIQNKVDCKGLLVYIGSSTYIDHLTLTLDSGRLLLTFNNGEGTIAVEYSRADVNFCDGNWYEVEVAKSGANGHLIINGTDSEMSSTGFSVFTSIDSNEPLFVGGIPSNVATEHNVMFTPFSGCMRNLMLHCNGQIVPTFISRSVELVNVNLETCSL